MTRAYSAVRILRYSPSFSVAGTWTEDRQPSLSKAYLAPQFTASRPLAVVKHQLHFKHVRASAGSSAGMCPRVPSPLALPVFSRKEARSPQRDMKFLVKYFCHRGSTRFKKTRVLTPKKPVRLLVLCVRISTSKRALAAGICSLNSAATSVAIISSTFSVERKAVFTPVPLTTASSCT